MLNYTLCQHLREIPDLIEINEALPSDTNLGKYQEYH